jgi:hypothetical protein
MPLKGHMALSGASLHLLKAEYLKRGQERNVQEDDKGGEI